MKQSKYLDVIDNGTDRDLINYIENHTIEPDEILIRRILQSNSQYTAKLINVYFSGTMKHNKRLLDKLIEQNDKTDVVDYLREYFVRIYIPEGERGEILDKILKIKRPRFFFMLIDYAIFVFKSYTGHHNEKILAVILKIEISKIIYDYAQGVGPHPLLLDKLIELFKKDKRTDYLLGYVRYVSKKPDYRVFEILLNHGSIRDLWTYVSELHKTHDERVLTRFLGDQDSTYVARYAVTILKKKDTRVVNYLLQFGNHETHNYLVLYAKYFIGHEETIYEHILNSSFPDLIVKYVNEVIQHYEIRAYRKLYDRRDEEEDFALGVNWSLQYKNFISLMFHDKQFGVLDIVNEIKYDLGMSELTRLYPNICQYYDILIKICDENKNTTSWRIKTFLDTSCSGVKSGKFKILLD